MRVVYHPDFPKDIKKFEAQYRHVSHQVALRFRAEVDKAIDQIIKSPKSAGHFANTGSQVVKRVRRRNLHSFPFFILYGLSGDAVFFGELKASASDPLTWFKRFPLS